MLLFNSYIFVYSFDFNRKKQISRLHLKDSFYLQLSHKAEHRFFYYAKEFKFIGPPIFGMIARH